MYNYTPTSFHQNTKANKNVARQQGRRETLLQGLQGCRQVRPGIREPLAEGQGWCHGVPNTVVPTVPLLRGLRTHCQVLSCARQEQRRGGEACCFEGPPEAHPGPRGVQEARGCRTHHWSFRPTHGR